MVPNEPGNGAHVTSKINEPIGAISKPPAPPGVLIVEDHQLLAQSLSYSLAAEGFAVSLAGLETVDSVMQAAEQAGATIVLLDLDLGGTVGDGTALIGPLRERGARVLVVTGSADRPRLATCLELGAVGVLSKSTPYETLLAAIMDVAAGRDVTSAAERQALLAELRAWRSAQRARLAPFERLTNRESQVLAALMDGKSCESIATEWFVSEATVRSQIRGVLTKLDAPSQLAAVALAQRMGWAPPPR